MLETTSSPCCRPAAVKMFHIILLLGIGQQVAGAKLPRPLAKIDAATINRTAALIKIISRIDAENEYKRTSIVYWKPKTAETTEVTTTASQEPIKVATNRMESVEDRKGAMYWNPMFSDNRRAKNRRILVIQNPEVIDEYLRRRSNARSTSSEDKSSDELRRNFGLYNDAIYSDMQSFDGESYKDTLARRQITPDPGNKDIDEHVSKPHTNEDSNQPPGEKTTRKPKTTENIEYRYLAHLNKTALNKLGLDNKEMTVDASSKKKIINDESEKNKKDDKDQKHLKSDTSDNINEPPDENKPKKFKTTKNIEERYFINNKTAQMKRDYDNHEKKKESLLEIKPNARKTGHNYNIETYDSKGNSDTDYDMRKDNNNEENKSFDNNNSKSNTNDYANEPSDEIKTTNKTKSVEANLLEKNIALTKSKKKTKQKPNPKKIKNNNKQFEQKTENNDENKLNPNPVDKKHHKYNKNDDNDNNNLKFDSYNNENESPDENEKVKITEHNENKTEQMERQKNNKPLTSTLKQAVTIEGSEKYSKHKRQKTTTEQNHNNNSDEDKNNKKQKENVHEDKNKSKSDINNDSNEAVDMIKAKKISGKTKQTTVDAEAATKDARPKNFSKESDEPLEQELSKKQQLSKQGLSNKQNDKNKNLKLHMTKKKKVIHSVHNPTSTDDNLKNVDAESSSKKINEIKSKSRVKNQKAHESKIALRNNYDWRGLDFQRDDTNIQLAFPPNLGGREDYQLTSINPKDFDPIEDIHDDDLVPKHDSKSANDDDKASKIDNIFQGEDSKTKNKGRESEEIENVGENKFNGAVELDESEREDGESIVKRQKISWSGYGSDEDHPRKKKTTKKTASRNKQKKTTKNSKSKINRNKKARHYERRLDVY